MSEETNNLTGQAIISYFFLKMAEENGYSNNQYIEEKNIRLFYIMHIAVV